MGTHQYATTFCVPSDYDMKGAASFRESFNMKIEANEVHGPHGVGNMGNMPA